MLNDVSPESVRDYFYGNNIEHYNDLLGGAAPLKNSLPYFTGVYTQRGHGFIGDIFRRFAIPLLHRAKPIALAGVSGVVRDIRKGVPLRVSIKKRGKQALRRVIGKGRKKKKTAARRKKSKNIKRRKRVVRKTVAKKKYPLFA